VIWRVYILQKPIRSSKNLSDDVSSKCRHSEPPVTCLHVLFIITCRTNQVGLNYGYSGKNLFGWRRGRDLDHMSSSYKIQYWEQVERDPFYENFTFGRLLLSSSKHTHTHTYTKWRGRKSPAYWPLFGLKEKVLFHFAIDVLHNNSHLGKVYAIKYIGHYECSYFFRDPERIRQG
jgi:hypothetical protein